MTDWPAPVVLSLEDYGKIDVLARLEQAVSTIVNEHGPDPLDPVVYEIPDSAGFHVSDMLTDAIVEIKRLRGSLAESQMVPA
jgi:hypothetical protein